MSAADQIRVWLSLAGVVLGVGSALVAIRFDARAIYAIAKGIASVEVVLIALAGPLDAPWKRLALAALVLSTIGDVALGLGGKGGFVAGLIAFALAHGVFVMAFVPTAATEPVLALLALIPAAGVVITAMWASAHITGRMYYAVLVYAAIALTMMASGIGAGIALHLPILSVGVICVVASDIAVARQQFSVPSFANRLWGLPLYYLGQVLIALAIATG